MTVNKLDTPNHATLTADPVHVKFWFGTPTACVPSPCGNYARFLHKHITLDVDKTWVQTMTRLGLEWLCNNDKETYAGCSGALAYLEDQ